MAEEIAGKVTETPSPGTVNGPETQPDVGADTQPQDQYAGKNADELKAIARERDSFIGRQAEEIGEIRRLRDEVSYLKGTLESRSIFDRGMEVTPQPAKEEEFDFTRPKESVERLVEARLAKDRTQRDQYERQRNAVESQSAFEQGKRAAYDKDPTLYRGIEKEIEGALFKAWQVGAATKETLSNPRTWRTAAMYIRDERGELENVFGRKPVSPVVTDRPATVRSQAGEDEVPWDESDRRLMERWGISEKEAVEGLKKGISMRERGEVR